MIIDFIGDIHGHAEQLEALLKQLGYREEQGAYRCSGHQVFFLGDFIDRGSDNPRVLDIARRMIEAGSARAVMGNHEYNALGFHYPAPSGGHLRPHKIVNVLQHVETMRQFKGRQKLYEEYLHWFFEIPLFHEEAGFRAVHACWSNRQIDFLKPLLDAQNRMNEALLYAMHEKGSPLHQALEITLKGKELVLPEGLFYEDKEGHKRREVRIRWWDNPLEHSFRSLSVHPAPEAPNQTLSLEDLDGDAEYYSPEQKPVFFGHYWLQGQPRLLSPKVCCLDFSVAKGGYLASYRFEGESELRPEHLSYV